MKKIRVLLVDDHEIVRLGLLTLINDQADMQVVGEAGSAAEALTCVEKLHPDVVLMDIRLPGCSGIEATRQIVQKFPQSKIIILTSYRDNNLVVQAIRAGAMGYVLKQVGNRELLQAIRVVAIGEAQLDPAATAQLLAHVRHVEQKLQDQAFQHLSEREMDVLVEVMRGKTNFVIGQTLNLQEKTVRNYISTILEKLNLSNRIELAVYAVKNNLPERLNKQDDPEESA
ncbi:MAG: response regulator transcription factor [Anaerolineaceae bacterium]|nr:response regulator transcription factor [Anaerolineaceae bacterium]